MSGEELTERRVLAGTEPFEQGPVPIFGGFHSFAGHATSSRPPRDVAQHATVGFVYTANVKNVKTIPTIGVSRSG
jgi:hypothetical protein